VCDLVVGGERSEWFSGCAAADQVRVGEEPAEPLAAWFGAGGGGSIVRERADEDRRVDRAEHVLAGAQVGRRDDLLRPTVSGDDPGGDVVESAVPLGPGQRPGQVALVQPERIGAAVSGPAGGRSGCGRRRDTRSTHVFDSTALL
jgi:hypothetical protein